MAIQILPFLSCSAGFRDPVYVKSDSNVPFPNSIRKVHAKIDLLKCERQQYRKHWCVHGLKNVNDDTHAIIRETERVLSLIAKTCQRHRDKDTKFQILRSFETLPAMQFAMSFHTVLSLLFCFCLCLGSCSFLLINSQTKKKLSGRRAYPPR